MDRPSRQPMTNPFYANPPSASTPTSPPPSYSRPVPAAPSNGPVSYGSLSDLTKGKGGQQQSGFSYTPQPERQGYRAAYEEPDQGRRMPPPPSNYGVQRPSEPPRRNVPPGKPTLPSPSLLSVRRLGNPEGKAFVEEQGEIGSGRVKTAARELSRGVEEHKRGSRMLIHVVERTATPPTRMQTAQSYIPNGVSATATSAADRVRDGFDSIATQQRREQVVSGAGKVAAGAAKLAGKAAWQLGKFASGSK